MIEAGYAIQNVLRARKKPDSFTDVLDSKNTVIHVSHVHQSHLVAKGLCYPVAFSSSFITEWLHRLLTDDNPKRPIKPLFSAKLPLLGMGTKEVRALLLEVSASSGAPHYVKWGHTKEDAQLVLDKNSYGYGSLKTGKTFAQADKAYSQWGGELLIANRPQIKTKRILACLGTDPLLSTAFWTSRFPPGSRVADRELTLMWLNSTPGLLMFLSSSLHKKGELFEFKKSQADYFWIPDSGTFSVKDVHSCWKKVKDATFGLYKDDYQFLATQKDSNQRNKNPRYVIDRLFVDHLYTAGELDKLYQDLAVDPIFHH